MKIRSFFAILAVALILSPALFAEDAPAMFKNKCAMCHGPDGTANTSMGKKLNIRSFALPDVQKQTDEQLSQIIQKGKNGKMPPFEKKLNADQTKTLVAVVRSFAKK